MNARVIQVAGITGIFTIAAGVCLVGLDVIDGDDEAPAAAAPAESRPAVAPAPTPTPTSAPAPTATPAPAPAPAEPTAPVAEATVVAEIEIAAPATIVDPLAEATEFFEDFVDAHRSGDVDRLRDTLHPVTFEHFGVAECELYLVSTVGSVDAVWVNAAEPASYDLETPAGPVAFDDVLRVDLVFSTPNAVGVEQQVHLPIVDGELTWLTRCGQD